MNFILLLLVILPYALLDAAALASSDLVACRDVVGIATSQRTPTSRVHIIKSVCLTAPFYTITCVYTDDHSCFEPGDLRQIAVSIDAQGEQQLETIGAEVVKSYVDHVPSKKGLKLKIAFLKLYPHLVEFIYTTNARYSTSAIGLEGLKHLILFQDARIRTSDKPLHEFDVEKEAAALRDGSTKKDVHMVIDIDRWLEVIQNMQPKA